MKKKILCAGLSAVLALSGGTAALAETKTITTEGGTESHPVYATYSPIAEAPTVYAVEITWGSMEFTYQAATTTKIWDPATHTYKEETGDPVGWTNDEGANKVTVTSRSNKALTAAITTKMVNNDTGDYSGITATPAANNLLLADASIGATITVSGTASTAATTITLSGVLENKEAKQTPIGQVTVTIADAEEEVTP